MAIKKAKTGRTRKKYNLRKPTILTVITVKLALQKRAVIKKGLSLKGIPYPLKSDDHLFQKRFEETPYFKEKAKLRYKIEAKNAERKQRHSLDVARALGLFDMELQAVTTIFVVKRMIIRLYNFCSG